jgi:site-specific recombinase XerD
MTEISTQMLKQATRDYLQWMRSMEKRGSKKLMRYGLLLVDFIDFVKEKNVVWEDMFTSDTLKGFGKYTSHKNPSDAIRGLSLYLFDNKRIPQPLPRPYYQIDLPEIYEQYLIYYEKSREVTYIKIRHIRGVLTSFYEFLERLHIELGDLKIDHIEAFMAECHKRLAPATCKTYRFYLHGFLKYLYHERKILPQDLDPLVVGARLFDKSKSAKFFQPKELQKLFTSLKLTTPTHIRTYAMVHLVYHMGLHPGEICRIKLDDLDFKNKELILQNKMADNVTIRPMPQKTIKAIAVYLLIARPKKSKYRNLFLSLKSPYKPISPGTVTRYVSKTMKQSGLLCSPYLLRHTYALNLINAGAKTYESKEMQGILKAHTSP